MNGPPASRRPVEVLLVEDHPPDARLIEEAFRAGPRPKTVHTVSGGDEAMSYLLRRSPFADAARPKLVVLDLNLPGRDGRDVLREIKSDPDLRRIPIVVLTASDAPSDVENAYDLHANAYIVKPVGLDAFTDVIRAVEEFWLGRAHLPE